MNKTTEALKLAEEALWILEQHNSLYYGNSHNTVIEAQKALAAIREVLAEPEITTPDVCGEVCARAKLCYGCNKAFDEALADHVEQNLTMVAEPVIPEWVDVDDYEGPPEQEPVAILKSSKANFERQFGKQVFADWIYDDLTYSFENAAPVDAKAIRALKLVYDNSTSHDWPDDIWEAIEEAIGVQIDVSI